jgi:PPOX class probable F420-dependent enzyme
MLVDETTDFGRRAATHLREDLAIWLTTVSPTGAPLPTPVWFLWDGEDTIRLNSLPTARRVAHITANSHVSLNFAGTSEGGDIVVFSGDARIDPSAPRIDQVDGYVEKYRDRMQDLSLTPGQFAERYAEQIVITLTRLRGH